MGALGVVAVVLLGFGFTWPPRIDEWTELIRNRIEKIAGEPGFLMHKEPIRAAHLVERFYE